MTNYQTAAIHHYRNPWLPNFLASENEKEQIFHFDFMKLGRYRSRFNGRSGRQELIECFDNGGRYANGQRYDEQKANWQGRMNELYGNRGGRQKAFDACYRFLSIFFIRIMNQSEVSMSSFANILIQMLTDARIRNPLQFLQRKRQTSA